MPLDESGKPKLHPVKNLLTASTPELIASLDHPNLTVRLNATQLLVHRADKSATPPLAEAVKAGSEYSKAHALWVLSRLGKLDESLLGRATRDPSPLVRTHAQRILTEQNDWNGSQRKWAIESLADPSADVRRAAAQALAAHPGAANVEPLLLLRRTVPPEDTHLLHVVRMALRDQFRHDATAKAIAARAWDAAQTSDLADVCPGVHTEAAAKFLANVLMQTPNGSSTRKDYMHAVVRYGSADDRATIGGIIRDRFANVPGTQAGFLKIVHQALAERGEKLGPAELKLAEEIIPVLLASNSAGRVQDAIDLSQSLRLPSTLEPLLNTIRMHKGNAAIRGSAIAAVVAIDANKSQAPLAALLVDDKEDLAVREQIAQALAGTNQPAAHETLIRALNRARRGSSPPSPSAWPVRRKAAKSSSTPSPSAKRRRACLQDRGLVLKLQQAKVAKLDERLASLTKGLPAADQKLLELLGARKSRFDAGKWDAAQGQAVFQKHCAACHQVANQGAKIGPQLDGIGVRGVDRLLEDILDPSRNVDQAFRTTSLELENGRFLTGLLLREEGETLVMADAQGKDVRVQKANVVNRGVGPLSPMPANFWEQIPEEDFHRMMAYLLAQRPKN